MVFSRLLKKIYLLFFPFFLAVSFLSCNSVSAWSYDEPFFQDSYINLTRSYGSQAEGAPYLVVDDYVSGFDITSYIYDATDSSIQTKKVFNIYASGFTLTGGNSANKYQTGQAIFYFFTNKASYESFANGLEYRAYYHKLYGDVSKREAVAVQDTS